MAPLPNVPGVIKVRVSGSIASAANWAVLDYWRFSGSSPSDSELGTFSGEISAAWLAHMSSQFPNAVLMTSVEVQDLTSATSAFGSDGTLRSSSGGSSVVPASVCLLESKRGALRYRGGHSRTYWPGLGPAGSLSDASEWGATQVSTFGSHLSDYLNAIIAAAAGHGFGPIQRSIVHYTGHATGVTYPFVEDVLTSTLETKFASQRRRLGR